MAEVHVALFIFRGVSSYEEGSVIPHPTPSPPPQKKKKRKEEF